jgi:hypothetical protein
MKLYNYYFMAPAVYSKWTEASNGKLLLTEHHAMETYWGNESIAPRILDLGIILRREVSFTSPTALPPGKDPLISIG